MAVFRSGGTMPVVRDVLMMFVMVGKRMSILFLLPTFPQQFVLNRLLSAYIEKEAMIPHLDEDF